MKIHETFLIYGVCAALFIFMVVVGYQIETNPASADGVLGPQVSFDALIGIIATLIIYAVGRRDGNRQSEESAKQRLSDAKGILHSVHLELLRMLPFVAQSQSQNYKPRVISHLYPYGQTLPTILITDIDIAYHHYDTMATGQIQVYEMVAVLKYVTDEVQAYLDKGLIPKDHLPSIMGGNSIRDKEAFDRWEGFKSASHDNYKLHVGR